MRTGFLLAAVLVSQFVAQLAKAEAISCRTVDGDHLESQLHVYLLSDGRFGLEISSCGGHALAHSGCQPYSKEAVLVEGTVTAAHRQIPNGRFSGEGVDVFPVAGGYQYTDLSMGLRLYFPDADCQQ